MRASNSQGKPLTARRLTTILISMKISIPMTLLLCALFGCSDDTSATSTPDVSDVSEIIEDIGDSSEPLDTLEPEVVAPVAPTAWTESVQVVSFVDSEVVSGDTTEGPSIGGTWGYQVGAGCWLVPEASYYGGNARFFAPSPVPGQNTKLTVTLSPAEDVDLNLSVLTMPLDEFWFPPEVELSSCYSSRDGGPGEVEEKKIFTITDVSNVLVMVVSPEGEEGGAFDLSFLLE